MPLDVARCPSRADAAPTPTEVLDELHPKDAEGLVGWAAEAHREGLVLSTSFGIQSAVLLHLATRVVTRIPVIWIDTGYLPAETYRYAETLRERLDLNLVVAQAELSPARMEALHGRLWESRAVADLDRYDRIRKVEPMNRTLAALGATGWLSGLRAEQTAHRRRLARIGEQGGRAKILPILHWNRRDVFRYLTEHGLPQHPLFEQGYATVGDWHASRPQTVGDGHERDTRFGGLKQECGLHLDDAEAASLDSSRL